MSTSQLHDDGSADHTQNPSELEWEQIRSCLRGLRFGSVHIVVQDGVIVQIERTEKRRLRRQVRPSQP